MKIYYILLKHHIKMQYNYCNNYAKGDTFKMRQRRYILFALCLLFITGCSNNEEPITIDHVSDLLFRNVRHVWLSLYESHNRELNDLETKIFQAAIKKGIDFQEIKRGEMPRPFYTNGNAIFKIQWRNYHSINLIYEKQSGYLYVYKDKIPWKKSSYYMKNKYLANKFLIGVLKFHPSSSEIERLLK